MATVIKSSGMLVREKLDAAYMELWKHDHHLSYKFLKKECELRITKDNKCKWWWPFDTVAHIVWRNEHYHCYLFLPSYLEIFQKAFPEEPNVIELCDPF